MKFFKSTLCVGYLANIVSSKVYSQEYQNSTPLQECLQNMLHCLEEPCDLKCKCNLAGETLKCFDTCDSVLQTDQLYVAAKLNYNSYCSAFILDDNPVDPPVPTSDPVVDPVPTSDLPVPTSDPVVDPDPTSTDPVVDPTSTDPVVDPTSTDPVSTSTEDSVVDPTPTDPPIPDGFQAVNPNANTFAQESSHGSIYSTGTRMEVMWLLIVLGVMVL
jgi:hypothetical protein